PRKAVSVKAIQSGRYAPSSPAAIPVHGKFGLGISSVDRHRAGGFTNGVYSIELFIDGVVKSTILFEELDFNTSRGIHSYIDYSYWKKTKIKYQKSFKDPGNAIDIFKDIDDQSGVISLDENKVYQAKYVVKDVQGNCSELNFTLKNTVSSQPEKETRRGVQILSYNKENSFKKEDAELTVPKGTLYGDVDFTYSTTAQRRKGYSLTHQIHNNLTPLFSSYNLRIKPTNLPVRLQDKALIASVENGSEGG